MQEVSVFGNYSVKIPIAAIMVMTNRWKIESSSTFMTTIILKETIQSNSVSDEINKSLRNYDSNKFKLNFDSKQEISKPKFKIYIRSYKGTAGYLPISFTCVILDELNTQRRFIFELNSLGNNHSYIADSIVDSFRENN